VVDFIHDRIEHRAAVHHRQLAPGALQRSTGSGNGRIDFRLAGFMDVADQRIVDRVAFFVGLTAGVGNVFAVDEVLDLLDLLHATFSI